MNENEAQNPYQSHIWADELILSMCNFTEIKGMETVAFQIS